MQWGGTERPEPTKGIGAILYVGTDMVTIELNGQIQWAAHAPAMFTYLHGHYKWADNQLTSQTIGQTMTQTTPVPSYIKNVT